LTRFIPNEVVASYDSIAKLNANFDRISNLLELCVLRDGTGVNSMLTNFDMNHFAIQNLHPGVAETDAVTVAQLRDFAESYLASITKGVPGSPGEGYATRAMISALTPSNLDDVYLTEPGREGKFVFSSANLSTFVTADPEQGVFIAPDSDPTGASGAWQRADSLRYWVLNVRHFGAALDKITDDSTAVLAAIDLSYAMRNYDAGTDYSTGGGPSVVIPGWAYMGSTSITTSHTFRLFGYTVGSPSAMISALKWDDGVTGIYNNERCPIFGLGLIGGFDGTEGEFHAIEARWTFPYEHLQLWNWSGDGMHLDDAGGIYNHNSMHGSNVFVSNCRNGYWNKQGSNNSAGQHDKWMIVKCREWGIKEQSFLGVAHSGHEAADCGLTVYNNGVDIGISVTSWNGNRYFAIAGQETWCSTHAPSGDETDNQGWAYNGAGGAAPWAGIIEWFNGILVRAGGSYYCDSANGPSSFVGCYAEGGQGAAQLRTLSVVIGGNLAQSIWRGNASWPRAPGLFGSNDGLKTGTAVDATGGYTGSDETISPALGEISGTKTWLKFSSSVNFPLPIRWSVKEGGMQANYADSTPYIEFGGPLYSRDFGRTVSPGAGAVYIPKLFYGSGGRQIEVADNAPTTNEYARGDFIFNRSPNELGIIGWNCVAGGTPGTWQPLYCLPGPQGPVWDNWTGIGSRASIDTATATVGNCAEAIKTLIEDLKVRGVLG
jgi:hypothetical protein